MNTDAILSHWTKNLNPRKTMTPLGNYVSDPKNTSATIDPQEFIQANWTLTSELAELYPTPSIIEVNDFWPEDIGSEFRTGLALVKTDRLYSLGIQPRYVWDFCKAPDKPFHELLNTLWGIQAGMIRLFLSTYGIIPRDQLIDGNTAVDGGFSMTQVVAIFTICNKISHPRDRHLVFDRLIIHQAITRLLSNTDVSQELDVKKIAFFLRVERDKVTNQCFL